MPRGSRKRSRAHECVMGQVHDLPVFRNQKESEAERVAFFERAWAQKHAREKAQAERAQQAHARATTEQRKTAAKKPGGRSVVAVSDDESGDESD